MKVIIHFINNNTADFETDKTPEEIIEEIFRKKIYGCHYANKFVAINTDNITIIEIK